MHKTYKKKRKAPQLLQRLYSYKQAILNRQNIQLRLLIITGDSSGIGAAMANKP